jgi:hypothetical protein
MQRRTGEKFFAVVVEYCRSPITLTCPRLHPVVGFSTHWACSEEHQRFFWRSSPLLVQDVPGGLAFCGGEGFEVLGMLTHSSGWVEMPENLQVGGVFTSIFELMDIKFTAC